MVQETVMSVCKNMQTLKVPVDQVYLIKHRLTKMFEEALKELETKLG